MNFSLKFSTESRIFSTKTKLQFFYLPGHLFHHATIVNIISATLASNMINAVTNIEYFMCDVRNYLFSFKKSMKFRPTQCLKPVRKIYNKEKNPTYLLKIKNSMKQETQI